MWGQKRRYKNPYTPIRPNPERYRKCMKAYIPIAKLQILTIYGRYQYLWYRYVFKTGFLKLSSVLLGDSLTSFGKTRK